MYFFMKQNIREKLMKVAQTIQNNDEKFTLIAKSVGRKISRRGQTVKTRRKIVPLNLSPLY